MIYITGDCHGQFQHINDFCCENKTTIQDILICLGDVGINYNENDDSRKFYLSQLPITLFCIRGNHDKSVIDNFDYKIDAIFGSEAYVNKKYPNQIFAIDGNIYTFDNKKCIVIGGAYSVDKYLRLTIGLKWFEDEQLSSKDKKYVENQLAKCGNIIDVVLSHTCPYKYMPKEWFLSGVEQKSVDTSMEIWLDNIEQSVNYNKWYCGHYHGEKNIDKLEFLYKSIKKFNV